MCTCVWEVVVFMCLQVSVHVCACALRSQVNLEGHSLEAFCRDFETGPHTGNRGLLIQLDWLATKPQRSPVSTSLALGFQA